MDNNEIDKLCEAAIIESQVIKMNKRKARALKKDPHQRVIFTRQFVNLDEIPVSVETIPGHTSNVRATMGNYALCYLGSMSFRAREKTPFVIRQDLLNMPIYVSGPAHWHCLCKRIPECKWMERNTTLTDDLFGVAKKHPGMNFLFTVKWVEYADKITNRAKELGIDIDNKPFLTYKMSKDRYEKDFKNLEIPEPKTSVDYFNELNEAEIESRAMEEN